MAQFKRGWSYTFIYQMVDNQGGDSAGFGLFHTNNTPKLGATYIHNLTTILADNSSFTPGALNYSIPSEPATVHDLLLQKSNDTFYRKHAARAALFGVLCVCESLLCLV